MGICIVCVWGEDAVEVKELQFQFANETFRGTESMVKRFLRIPLDELQLYQVNGSGSPHIRYYADIRQQLLHPNVRR